MIRFFLTNVLLLFLFVPTTAQELAIEAEIAKSAVILSDAYDFEEISDVVKDKRIVILGERTHFDGTTFQIKTELISHLIENCGFDVLGLECGSFIESQILPQYSNEIAGQEFDLRLVWNAGVWTKANECQKLINNINIGSVPFFGFDTTPSPYAVACLRKMLVIIDPIFDTLCDWGRMNDVYSKIVLDGLVSDVDVPVDYEIYFIDVISTLNNYCKLFLRNPDYDSHKVSVAIQGLKNLRSQYREVRLSSNKEDRLTDYEWLLHGNNIRDRQMAENIIWYLDANPEKKIIIWCANFHGAKNLYQCEYPDYPSSYMRTQVMGEHLYEKYGDDMYSIAFSTTYGEPSMELCLYLLDMQFGFVNFSSLRSDEKWFDTPFNSNIIGLKSGKWVNIFDGCYFIRNMQRSTKINLTEGSPK